MIKLQIANYTNDQRAVLHGALYGALHSIPCPPNGACEKCPKKIVCADISRVVEYLETAKPGK